MRRDIHACRLNPRTREAVRAGVGVPDREQRGRAVVVERRRRSIVVSPPGEGHQGRRCLRVGDCQSRRAHRRRWRLSGLTRVGSHSKYGFGELQLKPVTLDKRQKTYKRDELGALTNKQ